MRGPRTARRPAAIEASCVVAEWLMHALSIRCVGVCLLLGTLGARAADAPQALTPPMGWNSWNRFGCDVSESLVRGAAEALVATGMKDAGYRYVVIDDCWQVARDDSGDIVVDAERFPSGMKALADYVHAKGLAFGIYSDAGRKTCQGRPGSFGHEARDAAQYAAWGVDYLKYDWCNAEGIDARAAYSVMRRALDATGRPIVFSMCEWGTHQPWTWARGVAHLWRTTGDITDCWACEKTDWGGLSVTAIVDLNEPLARFAGPGGWNDPDMLEVGNSGLNDVEARAHFSLWAIMAAPLMAGNDLGAMTPATRDILLNREVIDIDQDPRGVQGRRVRDDGDLEVWSKPLADGGVAVVLLNRGNAPALVAASWQEIGLDVPPSGVRDLWAHADRPAGGRLEATVAPHGVEMFRVK
jgi:alpha-galactosidase